VLLVGAYEGGCERLDAIARHIALDNDENGCHVEFLKCHMKIKQALLEGVTAHIFRALSAIVPQSH
jgi:hypothetical protein